MTWQAFPKLVAQAKAVAARRGFTKSCTDETGRVLRALAASKPGGKMLEIGTGTGVGTAWLADGMCGNAQLVSVDIDAVRSADAAAVFADRDDVRMMHANFLAAVRHGPFDLVFADAGPAKAEQADAVVRALRVGAIVILDDLTPQELWPDDRRGRRDPVREFWLKDDRLSAVELREGPRQALIIAVRRAD